MITIQPLVLGDHLPALLQALETHGKGGVDGPDGLRMTRIARAAQDSSAAVALFDGQTAGYITNLHDPGGGFELVESVGEVLAPWRRRGIGGRLIDWALQHAAGTSRSSFLEVVIDCLGDDIGLQTLLEQRGFSLTRLRHVTAPALGPQHLALPQRVDLRTIRADDATRLGDLQNRIAVAEPLVRGGETSILSGLRHPYLCPEHSYLACEPDDGRALGAALTLVWPESANDLWIETICVDPIGSPPGLLSFMLSEVMRRGADSFSTVSLGAPDPMLSEIAALGFRESNSWLRASLLAIQC